MNNKNNKIEIIHQKLGRNIILFQKIEEILKLLIIRSKIEWNIGPGSGNIAFEKNKKKVFKQTMGSLCNQSLDSFLTKNDATSNKDFSFSFSIDSDEFKKERKKSLKLINEERNHLIHELYQSYDFDNPLDQDKLLSKLDKQKELMDKEINILKKIFKLYTSCTKDLLTALSNKEIQKFIIS